MFTNSDASQFQVTNTHATLASWVMGGCKTSFVRTLPDDRDKFDMEYFSTKCFCPGSGIKVHSRRDESAHSIHKKVLGRGVLCWSGEISDSNKRRQAASVRRHRIASVVLGQLARGLRETR